MQTGRFVAKNYIIYFVKLVRRHFLSVAPQASGHGYPTAVGLSEPRTSKIPRWGIAAGYMRKMSTNPPG